MTTEPEASGRAFLGLVRHIKEKYGEPALRTVVENAALPTRTVFASTIRVFNWYPYESFSGFLSSAVRNVGGGDLNYARNLGAAAGQRDLSTIFRVYVALASAERLIRSCETIWPSYYRNAGRMVAVTWQPTNTTLRIEDFPRMHPAHCKLMEGWMATTMDTIGFRVSSNARETTCVGRGGPYHEFSCTWDRK